MHHAQVAPDIMSYNAAILVCRRCTGWQPALILLAAMPEVDLTPDADSFSEVIFACEKGKRCQEAPGLLATMQQAEIH